MLKWHFSKILAPDDLFHNIFQVILSHFYTHMKQQQQQQQQQQQKKKDRKLFSDGSEECAGLTVNVFPISKW